MTSERVVRLSLEISKSSGLPEYMKFSVRLKTQPVSNCHSSINSK